MWSFFLLLASGNNGVKRAGQRIYFIILKIILNTCCFLKFYRIYYLNYQEHPSLLTVSVIYGVLCQIFSHTLSCLIATKTWYRSEEPEITETVIYQRSHKWKIKSSYLKQEMLASKESLFSLYHSTSFNLVYYTPFNKHLLKM